MEQYSIVIKNALIVDGSGSPSYSEDVGIFKDKIVYIGEINDAIGAEVIDANGLVLSPGFIDPHSHSESMVFLEGSLWPKLKQGITTDVSGNCGQGGYPNSKSYTEYLKDTMGFTDKLTLILISAMRYLTSYKRFCMAIKVLSKLGPNVAFYIPHGLVRIAVIGYDNRKATPKEIVKMKKMVREAMKNGALGLSSGLIYPPGMFTPKEEFIELCKVVAEYSGVYATHMRSESDEVLECLAETIDIGRQTGVKVSISHHKVAGAKNWGKSVDTLKMIDEALKEGIEVYMDRYPYLAGNTFLNALLPPNCHSKGIQQLVEYLKDEKTKAEIKDEILNPKESWQNWIKAIGYENILVLAAEQTPNVAGKTLAKIATEINMDPFEALVKILIDNKGGGSMSVIFGNEEDLIRILKHPSTTICTDAVMHPENLETDHPRNFASFPRVLGKYVRDEKILTLEEAVRKMTSLPAQQLMLPNIGLIKVGYNADIVIFNPETIKDNNSMEDPLKENTGIKYIIVNGKISVKDNEYTNAASGKILKRQKK
ncbi:MAG: D-aminoacylase [archaeon]|nr:D-aminoacylase [archaeon]